MKDIQLEYQHSSRSLSHLKTYKKQNQVLIEVENRTSNILKRGRKKKTLASCTERLHDQFSLKIMFAEENAEAVVNEQLYRRNYSHRHW